MGEVGRKKRGGRSFRWKRNRNQTTGSYVEEDFEVIIHTREVSRNAGLRGKGCGRQRFILQQPVSFLASGLCVDFIERFDIKSLLFGSAAF
jgi:hypothetical protein